MYKLKVIHATGMLRSIDKTGKLTDMLYCYEYSSRFGETVISDERNVVERVRCTCRPKSR